MANNDQQQYPGSDYQEDLHYEVDESSYIRNNPDDVILQWQGPEYEEYPRSKRWYIGAALILSLIVFYALWTNSTLMAILFILIGVVGYLRLQRKPLIRDFAITYDGIIVGNEIFDFDDIRSFWIFYEPPHTRVISLHMRGRLTPYIHIPLHQRDPVEVREELLKHISEVHQEQSIIDTLERLFRI